MAHKRKHEELSESLQASRFPAKCSAEVKKLCEEVIATCLKMNTMGINQGTSGNVSVRLDENKTFAITPSGIPYEDLHPDHIVHMTLGDSPCYYGKFKPSSEWRIHYDLYRKFPNARAIVHAHPTFSTALSCSKGIDFIPGFHYMIAATGGERIEVAEYATYGTQELSDNVIRALSKPTRKACLMSNHGLVVYGGNLSKALWLANEVETLCKQYTQILSMSQIPKVLSHDELHTVLKKFDTYGKQDEEKESATEQKLKRLE